MPSHGGYFRDALIEEYVAFKDEPAPLTAAIIASEMPAAISAYSMDVAADLSEKNAINVRIGFGSPLLEEAAVDLTLYRVCIRYFENCHINTNISQISVDPALCDLADIEKKPAYVRF